MTVAYIALFGWPLVAYLFFRRFDVPLAVLITILAGYLLLPVGVQWDLPTLPKLNKNTVPAFSALFFAAVVFKGKMAAPGTTAFIPRMAFARLCLLMLFLCTFFTVFTNTDPLFFGTLRLPGMRLYDGFSIILTLLAALIPFALGHKYLAHPDMQRLFVKALVVAGLMYSLLALYEVRMSPQLNLKIYGFFGHNFLQHMRNDGFRPLVFLKNGLVLGVFFSMATLAAAGLIRIIFKTKKTKILIAALWLLMTLSLSKTLGALGITLFLLPVVLFLSTRLQLMIAAIVAVFIMIYPVLRGAGYVPTNLILSYVEQIDPDRAASLQFRFKNEDAFLEKVEERPLFGWGGYGRSRVFDTRGRDVSVADGGWIITLSVGGWSRYLAQFGLYCLPMPFLFFFRRRLNIGMETSILSLILTANLIDLIPNGSQSPITWMLAGALWGRISLGRATEAIDEFKYAASARARQRPRKIAP